MVIFSSSPCLIIEVIDRNTIHIEIMLTLVICLWVDNFSRTYITIIKSQRIIISTTIIHFHFVTTNFFSTPIVYIYIFMVIYSLSPCLARIVIKTNTIDFFKILQ